MGRFLKIFEMPSRPLSYCPGTKIWLLFQGTSLECHVPFSFLGGRRDKLLSFRPFHLAFSPLVLLFDYKQLATVCRMEPGFCAILLFFSTSILSHTWHRQIYADFLPVYSDFLPVCVHHGGTVVQSPTVVTPI